MDLDDACTLMALLHARNRHPIGDLIGGWDMLQADVPSHEQMERGVRLLVGSGLAEVDERWTIRLTDEGARILRSVKPVQGMRQLPQKLRAALGELDLRSAPITLPPSAFDPARQRYLQRVTDRAAARQRRPFWKLWG